MAARIDPEIAEALRGDPDRALDAVILATGRLEELLASLPDGVEVRQQYRLVGGVTVRSTAGVLRDVSRLREVKSIEPVRPVTHWGGRP